MLGTAARKRGRGDDPHYVPQVEVIPRPGDAATSQSRPPPVQRHIVTIGKHEVGTDAACAAALKSLLDELMRQQGTSR